MTKMHCFVVGGLGKWEKNTDCGEVSFHGNNTIAKCSQLSNKNFFAVMMVILSVMTQSLIKCESRFLVL